MMKRIFWRKKLRVFFYLCGFVLTIFDVKAQTTYLFQNDDVKISQKTISSMVLVQPVVELSPQIVKPSKNNESDNGAIEKNKKTDHKETAVSGKNLGDGFWGHDAKSAFVLAKKKNVPVVIVFSGTSWCHYCQLMNDEVFLKADFLELARGKFIPLKYECSPSGYLTQEGADLSKKYEVKGVPTVVVLDPEENILKLTGYFNGITPKKFMEIIEGCQSLLPPPDEE